MISEKSGTPSRGSWKSLCTIGLLSQRRPVSCHKYVSAMATPHIVLWAWCHMVRMLASPSQDQVGAGMLERNDLIQTKKRLSSSASARIRALLTTVILGCVHAQHRIESADWPIAPPGLLFTATNWCTGLVLGGVRCLNLELDNLHTLISA